MNTSKSHLLIPGHKYEELWTDKGENRTWETRNVQLLGKVIHN